MNLPNDLPVTVLRTLVQSLPSLSVLVFDHDLRYLMAEGQSLVRHGHDPAAMIGRSLFEVLPENRAVALAESYRSALAGQTVRHEHNVDGFVYASSFMPVYDANCQIVAGMVVVEDITKRH
ncbi:MAG: hypothetical protein OHK0022_10620 [Roseiflexaceae bacterium]